MPFVITRPPALEPVWLDEAKAHLRVDTAAEDQLIDRLITAAREHIEQYLGLALIDQDQSFLIDQWPQNGIIDIPRTPVMAVLEVAVDGLGGTTKTLEADQYQTDLSSPYPRLLLTHPAALPLPAAALNGIEIRLQLGFGATGDAVPAAIKQAMLLLIAQWYETRSPVGEGSNAAALPLGVETLTRPWRRARL